MKLSKNFNYRNLHGMVRSNITDFWEKCEKMCVKIKVG